MWCHDTWAKKLRRTIIPEGMLPDHEAVKTHLDSFAREKTQLVFSFELPCTLVTFKDNYTVRVIPKDVMVV